MKKAYIIIINYKNHLDTVECLESCLKQNYPDYQIIVVDNSPTYESIEYLRDWASGKISSIQSSKEDLIYPLFNKPLSISIVAEDEIKVSKNFVNNKITVIKANHNNGFGAANNVGISFIQFKNDYKYVWFLNNDTVIPNNTLSHLATTFENTPKKKLGLLGCTLVQYSSQNVVQGIGGIYNSWLGATRHVAEGLTYEQAKSKFQVLKKSIDYIIGASIFTSQEFIKKVGPFSEDYFLYFEELDWTKRAKKLGYEIATCLAIVYHKEGRAINNNNSYSKTKSKIADFYSIKNRFLFTKKYHKNKLLFIYLTTLIILFNRVIRGQFDRIPLVIRAIINK